MGGWGQSYPNFFGFLEFFSGDVLICKDLVFALQCQSVQRLYFDL